MSERTKIVKVNNIEVFGFIAYFIHPNSNKPLWKQVDIGCKDSKLRGWKDFKGFEIHAGDKDVPYIMQYPNDPPLIEIGRITIDNECLVMFSGDWVLWTDGTDMKIARIY